MRQKVSLKEKRKLAARSKFVQLGRNTSRVCWIMNRIMKHSWEPAALIHSHRPLLLNHLRFSVNLRGNKQKFFVKVSAVRRAKVYARVFAYFEISTLYISSPKKTIKIVTTILEKLWKVVFNLSVYLWILISFKKWISRANFALTPPARNGLSLLNLTHSRLLLLANFHSPPAPAENYFRARCGGKFRKNLHNLGGVVN